MLLRKQVLGYVTDRERQIQVLEQQQPVQFKENCKKKKIIIKTPERIGDGYLTCISFRENEFTVANQTKICIYAN